MFVFDLHPGHLLFPVHISPFTNNFIFHFSQNFPLRWLLLLFFSYLLSFLFCWSSFHSLICFSPHVALLFSFLSLSVFIILFLFTFLSFFFLLFSLFFLYVVFSFCPSFLFFSFLFFSFLFFSFLFFSFLFFMSSYFLSSFFSFLFFLPLNKSCVNFEELTLDLCLFLFCIEMQILLPIVLTKEKKMIHSIGCSQTPAKCWKGERIKMYCQKSKCSIITKLLYFKYITW